MSLVIKRFKAVRTTVVRCMLSFTLLCLQDNGGKQADNVLIDSIEIRLCNISHLFIVHQLACAVFINHSIFTFTVQNLWPVTHIHFDNIASEVLYAYQV